MMDTIKYCTFKRIRYQAQTFRSVNHEAAGNKQHILDMKKANTKTQQV